MVKERAAVPWFAKPLLELPEPITASLDDAVLKEIESENLTVPMRQMAEALTHDVKSHHGEILGVSLDKDEFVDDEGHTDHVFVLHLQVRGTASDSIAVLKRLSQEEAAIARALSPEDGVRFSARFRVLATRDTG